jgi:catechol 2,3-dioxygenase-like lactoylglutathione lyase family enzyme
MHSLFDYLRGLTLFIAGIVVGTVLISPSHAQQTSNGLRLNHVGIAVKDFQESLNFYTKVMGFKAAYAMPSPDGKPTTTFLQISRDTFIEMAPATANLPAGLTHIGLLTDDANASVTQLRGAGATMPDVRSGGGTGSRLSNTTDPNGIRLELVEQPSGSMMRKAMESWK